MAYHGLARDQLSNGQVVQAIPLVVGSMLITIWVFRWDGLLFDDNIMDQDDKHPKYLSAIVIEGAIQGCLPVASLCICQMLKLASLMGACASDLHKAGTEHDILGHGAAQLSG